MKIYNEVVIDMNPESSSYRETLHEDSFEHDGDMMLLQNVGDEMTTQEGAQTWYLDTGLTPNKLVQHQGHLRPSAQQGGSEADEVQAVYKYPIYSYDASGAWKPTGRFTEHSEPLSIHYDKLSMAPGGSVAGMEGEVEVGAGQQAMQNILEEGGYNASFDLNDDGTIDILDLNKGISSGQWTKEGGDFDTTEFDFTRTEGGEFDPTKDEFKQYVETTGGFDALATGYGLDPEMFDEAYLDPLKYKKQEYALEREELAETLKATTSSYQLARKSTGLQAGKSLFDIKRQVEGQESKGGFAGTGIIAATGKRAQKGLMADYNLQQEELAGQMAAGKSAFDFGMRGAEIGEAADVSQFWETEEDKFYTRAGELDATIYD